MKVPVQPAANLGMVGHVDHGKTTLTKALTGDWTDRHSEEIKRGISIKLGYADTAFFKCPHCNEPECYSNKKVCPVCGQKTELLRAVSFVDSPGHETLMATMISGAALMNGALLLIAANEPCPQPQTKEHLMALDIIGIRHIVIVQNKIDIVSAQQAEENYREILAFTKGTVAEGAPIIPVSAHHDANLDLLIMTIERTIPTPKVDPAKSPKMYIARSFDINLPGTLPQDLQGGVVGGSLIEGTVKVGDEVEIRPGMKVQDKKVRWDPILTSVTSLMSGGRPAKEVTPGGLVGIGTELDPFLTKSDSLVGNMLGAPGRLPQVWDSFTMKVHLLERIVGAQEDLKVTEIKTKEPLMLNVGVATTLGVVTTAHGDSATVSLKLPVCADKGQRVAISRKVGGRWRLIGYGEIR
ncbi:MAG: translation initiation factor IF-2 subunit gamma [Euryarchaeota archaeon]|nr:translation initiation factor IF-2 subunit gamma [Euryarchaeota archaeon]